MQIQNTKDYSDVASIVMCVYGMGGVGKSTFASTFPKPLLFDFENGAKYFKQRGINIDVVRMDDWFSTEEKKQLPKMVEEYETIILDPIGEVMEKLIKSETISGSKYRMTDGSLTMAGWGKVKDEFRALVKWLRDLDKHVVLVAHVEEKQSDETVIKRPLIATKISDEVIAMVDIVGYLELITINGEEKRVLRVSPTEKYVAKDRTGTLDKVVKPEFSYIYEQIKSRQEVVEDADAQETPGYDEGQEVPTEAEEKAKKVTKKKGATKKNVSEDTIASDIVDDGIEQLADEHSIDPSIDPTEEGANPFAKRK